MSEQRAPAWTPDPGLPGYVTDGGLETDLIFHHGVELPHFAAFPLLVDPKGRQLLVDYYSGYAQIASTAGAGLFLETPTWRASSDWGARLGVGAEGLVGVNTDAVRLLAELGQRYSDEVPEVVVAGLVGPRGDGYVVAEVMDPWQARDYHLAQARALADAGADLLSSLTLTTVTEAIGVALAAGEVGLPVTVGFTVETDGRLPDGTTLRAAIEAVDDVTPPDWFVVNCAHPSHVAVAVVDTGPWLERIGGTRVNASVLSHAELDGAEALDEGDPAALGGEQAALAASLPGLRVVGGCCGTDARHVAAMWGVPAPAAQIPPGVSHGHPPRRTGVRLGSSTGGASDSTRPQAHGSP
jgi:homocysteine S-methyltransferase